MSQASGNANKKPWLFLGLGNVLFNEDPAYALYYLLIYQILQNNDDSLTFDKLLQQRDEIIKEGDTKPLQTLIKKRLTQEESNAVRAEFRKRVDADWLKYNHLIAQSHDFLEKASKDYNLGVIANAPSFMRAILQELKILKYFRVMALSEEAGVPKPSKNLFKMALAEAAAIDGGEIQAIMLGDSLESDIRPAKELGMRTVQLVWDHNEKYREYNRGNGNNVEAFNVYLTHLQNYSSRRRNPENEAETPDFRVQSLAELDKIILSEDFRQKLGRLKLA